VKLAKEDLRSDISIIYALLVVITDHMETKGQPFDFTSCQNPFLRGVPSEKIDQLDAMSTEWYNNLPIILRNMSYEG